MELSRRESLYVVLVALFCLDIVLSNIIAIKLFHVPLSADFALSCGLLTYPFTFLLGDLVTELFGAPKARFMIYLGFAMTLLSHSMLSLAVWLPPHNAWVSSYNPFGYTNIADYQHAFSSIFGLNGLAVTGSLTAYSIAQLLDISLYSRIRKATQGRHLWLRNNVAILISQAVDTALVVSILLYFGLRLDASSCLSIGLLSYGVKVLFAIAGTPLLYLAVHQGKKFLGRESMPQLECETTV